MIIGEGKGGGNGVKAGGILKGINFDGVNWSSLLWNIAIRLNFGIVIEVYYEGNWEKC